MSFINEAKQILGQPESNTLEYKAVLPPPRTIAQLISGLANTQGGFIILGVHANASKIDIVGLSDDFRVNSVIHLALDLLSPKFEVEYDYFSQENKSLYAIKVEKSENTILVEGKAFMRTGDRTKPSAPDQVVIGVESVSELKTITTKISASRISATGSKNNFLDHYQSVINIIGDSKKILFPSTPSTPTPISEGKILSRILFTSSIDTFETYLSELLYEIFLAKPESLKNDQTVTIKEVLNCSDMHEFVIYWSNKKLSKLQRGSVKGFLEDTEQLASLKGIDKHRIEKIDQAFQIRHLYTHKNGIIDEKFLKVFPGKYTLNQKHELTVTETLSILDYLIESVDVIDKSAIAKFHLGIM